MTFEELTCKLKEKGIKKNQINSPTTAAIFAVITENDEFNDIYQLGTEIEHRKWEVANLSHEIGMLIRDRDTIRSNVEALKETRRALLSDRDREMISYIDSFFESLKQCSDEKEEATLKKAQLFINSIEVNSKYDNTAKIIGLATILTNGNLNGMEELKKINPDLFDIQKFNQDKRRRPWLP